MIFSWFTNRRRQSLASEPFPAEWAEWLRANVRYYLRLDASKQALVQSFVRIFSAEKKWYGGEGLEVTDEMKVTVAGQAALLTLGLDEPYYFDRMQSIVLYPAAFRHATREYRSFFGRRVLIGQAWYHSPIVLSWRDVLKCGRNEGNGANVVLHEFAHHLDGLDGDVNGVPALVGDERQQWHRVAEAEYRRLVGNARRGEATLLSYYGATSFVEFFAVATECLFEQPRAMSRRHAELYALLREFYRQDPAAWLTDADAKTGPAPPKADDGGVKGDAASDWDGWATATADGLFNLILVYLSEGRYEVAERAATRALELSPDDAELLEHRAQARVKLGRFAEALADCEAAFLSDPEYVDSYRSRAAALIGLQQQFEQAEKDLKRVFSETRNDAEAYYLRGLIASARGKFRRAVADLSRSIWIRPFSADAYYQRSLAHEKLGHLDDAESDRAKAFDLDPEADRPAWLRASRK
jgi:Mlc titration factor MtfA (ptsG expression regulator)/Flp pilus assembly protein TadD